MIAKKNENVHGKDVGQKSEDQKTQQRLDEDKLIHLALKWNYFDGVLPIFQARQSNMIEGSEHFTQVTIDNLEQEESVE